MEWNFEDAQGRLSEVLTLAATEGPQTIRQSGQSVVVVPEAAYRDLVGVRPTLKELILQGPSLVDVLPSRDPSPMRDAKL